MKVRCVEANNRLSSEDRQEKEAAERTEMEDKMQERLDGRPESVMSRLQLELTDKFLAFQKASEIRHINWEKEQRRVEANMLERWRVEQRDLQA